MYLSTFGIADIKCFGKEEIFDFPERQDGRHAGWHVILGANATGKTTVLQAMAVCLLGPAAWMGMVSPVGWARQEGDKSKCGHLRASLTKGTKDIGTTNQKGPFETFVIVTPDEPSSVGGQAYDAPQFVLDLAASERNKLLRSVYSSKKGGWFACGYGPFRRLSGGEPAKLTHPRQHRFASLFEESVALTQCEPWLLGLHHQAIDKDNPERDAAAKTLDVVKSIINSLLPGAVELQQVTSSGVRFTTTGGGIVLLSALSDGYRSFLALAIDLLRHITDVFKEQIGDLTEDVSENEETGTSGGKKVAKRVLVEGVVLIDEVDAHLHPSWQRTIGSMLQRVFPNIQFIVSTHSPFIAQAASEGGLFVLRPAPGNDVVRVVQPIPSVRGWRAEAILTSELFGLKDTIDPDTEEVLREYHKLSTKRSFGQLSAEEQAKLDQLEARLSRELTAPGETMEDFHRRREMEAYIDKTLEKLPVSEGEAKTS